MQGVEILRTKNPNMTIRAWIGGKDKARLRRNYMYYTILCYKNIKYKSRAETRGSAKALTFLEYLGHLHYL